MKTIPKISNMQLDLREQVCPYGFIRTKVALEGMAPGQILRITLRGRDVENVPRSIKEEGHEIVHVEKDEDSFMFYIKKCADEEVA